MTAPSARLGRRQKLLDGLGYAATRMGLAPTPAKVAAMSVAKRKASKPAGWMTLPLPAGVAFADRSIDTRGGALVLRVYTPTDIDGRQPPVLYIHGGGWIVGGLDSCHWLCAELCSRLRTVIVSVDYRLAPDSPYPAALEDCQDALAWLVGHGTELGVDSQRVVVGGDSAGGNLAAALALSDSAGDRRIVQQLLIYPALDLTGELPSWHEGLSRMMTPLQYRAGVEMYLGADGDVKDQLVSPVFADLGAVAEVAPAVVLTAQHDPLRDDGRAYADKLASAGVAVEYRNYGTMAHGFFSMPRVCRDSGRAMADLVSLAQSQLGRRD